MITGPDTVSVYAQMGPEMRQLQFGIHPLDDYRPERGELFPAPKTRFYRNRIRMS